MKLTGRKQLYTQGTSATGSDLSSLYGAYEINIADYISSSATFFTKKNMLVFCCICSTLWSDTERGDT